MHRLIDPSLKEELGEDIFTSNGGHNKDSIDTFIKNAYECLGEAAERTTMEVLIMELERAIKLHVSKYFQSTTFFLHFVYILDR
ncbi:hypothetical protein Hanom_Chr14g01274281 [Helianthus anomalus]